MNKGNLSHADFQTFLARLARPHNWEVSVELLNDKGEHLVSFDPGKGGGRSVTVTGGEVVVNADGRALTLSVADPDNELLVGQDANYINRMLRVRCGVFVPELDRTVWIEVFVGPIVSAPRTGKVVQFTAHGKERFAKHGIKDAYTIKKGVAKTTAIRRILVDLCGETPGHMGGIPDLRPTLADDLVLHIQDRPWLAIKHLADELDRYIAYDGGGDVQMPRMDATNPVYTFTGSRFKPGVIGTDPEISADWTQVKNAVRRYGTPPKSGGPAPEPGEAIAEGEFSPQNMGRNGVPIYYWDVATLSNIHTHKVLQQMADNALKLNLSTNRTVKFEIMPMPCFDFGDLVRVETLGLMHTFTLTAFTIPLKVAQDTGGEGVTMSIGYNRRVSANAFAGRR